MPCARPTNPSAVEVYAEADAGASQVDDVALVVGQLEAEVPQGDGASQVDHVVLVGVGFHDVAHALLADDLGDDVVAQWSDCFGRICQAAAAEIQLVVGVQAAAETAEITPLLAETGAAAAETGGFAAVATGTAEALGGAAAAVLAPEVAIPAAVGLAVGAGEAGTQTDPPRGSGVAAAAGGALEGARAGAYRAQYRALAERL